MFSDTLPSDILSSRDAGPASDARMQRAHGTARIALSLRNDKIRIDDQYQSAPCRVLMPRVDGRDRAEIVFINTAGGVAGGDQLDYGATVSDGATALITTQASEKIYGAIDTKARVATSLHVGAGSTLEWLPQQTIAYNGARLRRRTDIEVEQDGRLLALEWLVMGRHAYGETLETGSLEDSWRVHRDGKLVWADAFRLTGAIDEIARSASVLGDNQAFATLIYVGPEAEGHLDAARTLAENCGCLAGATHVGGVLVARFLAADGMALLKSVSFFLEDFRVQLSGLAPWPPRLWTC
jgi:urease accessory protein